MYFLSFFNFAFSPCQGTWLQGYKGRMHSPLVPVHVPMDLQGHFLNSSSRREKNSVPGFIPEFLGFVPRALKVAWLCVFSGTFSGLSLYPQTFQGHRDIFGFVLESQGYSRGTFSGLSFGFVLVPTVSLVLLWV